ncbi:biotin-requiring enzyme protein [Rutstroemia sp. NJR-2017a BVV2]|nr:biotin-requiring enzyme protein [Rutstroemia sp. NJR-2017a BVV2]
MPALSPTMTEGNIAKWNVKEGDSFSAGDVLLEIETDKASMDVEAQDDGVLAKITMPDGSKGIKVGTRIGVVAEPGDDLGSLEIPPEDSAAPPSPKEEASKPSRETSSESQAEASPSSKPSAEAQAPAKKTSGKAKKQTYPLLPSVGHLIREHGLDESAIENMTPSGPNGRLLKGDVLAYLGSISSSYPTELSTKISKLSHLDLSNIKLAAPAPAPARPTPSAQPAPIPNLDVSLPISMKAVLDVQTRIQSTLGIFLPLSTFISRATDVANDDLPRPKNYQPSANELFNSVLGLDKVKPSTTRGAFLPQIAALPQAAPAPKKTHKSDIYDILTGKSKSTSERVATALKPGLSNSVNVFTVNVPKGEEKVARVFLERVKTILEVEPGRLVL